MNKLSLSILAISLVASFGAQAYDSNDQDDASLYAAKNKAYVCYAYNSQGGSYGGFGDSQEAASRNASRNCAQYSKTVCRSKPTCYRLINRRDY